MFGTEASLGQFLQQEAQQNKPQQLPTPPNQDIARFETILNTGSLSVDRLDSSLQDVPILKTTPVVEPEASNLTESLIGKVAEVDYSYKNMLSQFAHMPKFSEYVTELETIENTDQMRSYPEVAEVRKGDVHQQQLDKIQAHMGATSEYQGMLTHWSINSQMFLSKIQIVSAAVRHVSEGFKTLFRAAG